MVSSALRLFDSFPTVRPSRDKLLDSYRKNFSRRGIPKSRPLREVTVDVAVIPATDIDATRLQFEVPVASPCHVCQGNGRTGFFHCDGCDGGGLAWRIERLDVLLPPPVRDGMLVPLSLAHLGVHNLYLRLRVGLLHD